MKAPDSSETPIICVAISNGMLYDNCNGGCTARGSDVNIAVGETIEQSSHFFYTEQFQAYHFITDNLRRGWLFVSVTGGSSHTDAVASERRTQCHPQSFKDISG